MRKRKEKWRKKAAVDMRIGRSLKERNRLRMK
jgi:hypothetical protein